MLRGSHDLLFFLIYDLLPAERKAALGELASLLAVDALQHTTAAGFPLEQVAVAYEMVEASHAVGNVVLRLRG